jgi:hypothetical protein
MLKRIVLRFVFLVVFSGIITFLFILFPGILYSGYSTNSDVSIYHSHEYDPALASQIAEAKSIVSASEFYNKDMKMEVCLNDGSFYPELIRLIRGSAFAWGFYNKVILQGNADYKNNFVELNNYKWKMSDLLAHEMVHCIQYDHLGL